LSLSIASEVLVGRLADHDRRLVLLRQALHLAAGAFDRLLLKPVDPWQLASEIEVVLRRRRASE
jgi:DNA-binding response OmpR family regulator